MFRPSFASPRRREGPPSIWDTHGISENVFANPVASSAAPYPQELNPWSSRTEEPLHSVETDFGQTDFGHRYPTDFGQTDFGQNRLWPKPTLAKTDFGQNRLWPKPTLAKVKVLDV